MPDTDSSGVMAAIRRRRSVRKYLARPVEDEKLEILLEAARLAPSASNSQPWHFIVVRNKETIENLSRSVMVGTTWVNRWMLSAPCVIVACGKRNPLVHWGAKALGIDLLKVDVAIAVEHICLAATDLDLGTCWIGWFSEKKVKKLLDIPVNINVIALLTVGYPADSSTKESIGNIQKRQRKEIKSIYSSEKY